MLAAWETEIVPVVPRNTFVNCFLDSFPNPETDFIGTSFT